MQTTTSLGANRTGIQMSPLSGQSMQSFADANPPPPAAASEHSGIAALRSDYVHEAERIGSVPLPATVTGALSTVWSKLTGKKPEVLVDKLGERLAFERTGVRLYQALIDKVEASAADTSQPLPFALSDLEHIRDEEFEHLQLLISIVQSMGADPTAQTPSADVSAVAAGGVLQVLTDPRTTISQCLTAVLTAELTDEAGWDLLIQLVGEIDKDSDLLGQLQEAQQHEEEHVQRVQKWVSQLVLTEAS